MKLYPIRVPGQSYRGSKESLRHKAAQFNADAAKLELYLNEKIAASTNPIQQLLYRTIALDVNLPEERVREILSAVDCGHNGLTVAKNEEACREVFGSSSTP